MLRERPPEFAREGRVSVLDYGGEGLRVLFVPSLINPPHVLDLSPHNSLLRWLSKQGVRPLLVDWGDPDAEERDLNIAGHVERYLLPLLARFDTPPILAGYCLGGTMALAAAAHVAVPAIALIAAPWRFMGFPDATRAQMQTLWEQASPIAERLGLLPMEVLQTGFWGIDPSRTIAKFERFAAMDPGSEAAQGFVALEDWANDGAPLTAAAGRQLLVDFMRADLPGTGRWEVGGKSIDPAALTCPVFNVISTTDRIVPAASAAPAGEQLVLGLGHVGMIVGGRAREQMWQPLAGWLSRVPQTC